MGELSTEEEDDDFLWVVGSSRKDFLVKGENNFIPPYTIYCDF